MFAAMLIVLVGSGVHALLPPQLLEPRPVSERVAMLERDYEHLSQDIKEIKELLKEQNKATANWFLYILGVLVAGDRGWAIYQGRKNNKREEKS